MDVKYYVIEDNGGGLSLFFVSDGDVLYTHAYDNPDILRDDMAAIVSPEFDPGDWDGNENGLAEMLDIANHGRFDEQGYRIDYGGLEIICDGLAGTAIRKYGKNIGNAGRTALGLPPEWEWFDLDESPVIQ